MAEEKQTETKTEQSPLRYRALVLGGTGEVGRVRIPIVICVVGKLSIRFSN